MYMRTYVCVCTSMREVCAPLFHCVEEAKFYVGVFLDMDRQSQLQSYYNRCHKVCTYAQCLCVCVCACVCAHWCPFIDGVLHTQTAILKMWTELQESKDSVDKYLSTFFDDVLSMWHKEVSRHVGCSVWRSAYTYTYVCSCMHLYAFVCICMHLCAFVCICMLVYMHVCAYIIQYMIANMRTLVCMYIRACVCGLFQSSPAIFSLLWYVCYTYMQCALVYVCM